VTNMVSNTHNWIRYDSILGYAGEDTVHSLDTSLPTKSYKKSNTNLKIRINIESNNKQNVYSLNDSKYLCIFRIIFAYLVSRGAYKLPKNYKDLCGTYS